MKKDGEGRGTYERGAWRRGVKAARARGPLCTFCVCFSIRLFGLELENWRRMNISDILFGRPVDDFWAKQEQNESGEQSSAAGRRQRWGQRQKRALRASLALIRGKQQPTFGGARTLFRLSILSLVLHPSLIHFSPVLQHGLRSVSNGREEKF